MANRYWVGGSGTWSSTNTANWSATSGGAGGASVPGSADNVIIDGNSGSPTVTTNYNVSVNGITVDAAAATLSLGGTLTTVSSFLNIAAGTFTTNSYAVNVSGNFNVAGSSTTTVNLGSSTVTVSGTALLNAGVGGTLTFNAGTSTLIGNASAQTIIGLAAPSAGVTFYNVSFTSTTATTHSITGVNTFNNLTVTAPSSAGVTQLTFDSRQTINGALSTTGTAGNRRVWFRSSTYGLARTLTINSAPSLTDADFRDIYVIGTAAPISGTRIGDLRGIRGITASTPKTVYWVTAAGGNWSANNWAASSGGAASTDNFPLAQDTAIIENTGLNASATVTLDAAIVNVSGINMSTRTSAMTLSLGTNIFIYGDLTCGSGTTYSSSTILTFSGRNTQAITSAGKTIGAVAIDSYGGTVQLADALNIGTNTITVTNGTFDTKNFNVTAGALSSSNSNVRTITLGSSTLTLSSATNTSFDTATNLTFNAGTSTISFSAASSGTLLAGGGLTFYNVTTTTQTGGSSPLFSGNNTFNNLTITAPTSGIIELRFSGNNTINGTLTVAGATAVRRIFVRSNTLGTTCTLTVNTLSADDCDFRDITIAGTAAGSSPTRAGDCGGNTGITFPAPKTVYWNLAGSQNWSADGWATSSGGVPATNNFPLAQDTAVFDDTGSAGTVTINAAWNIGTFDASARTSAMTLVFSNNPLVYGNWLFGTGVTLSSTGNPIYFSGRGTQTITSNGITFNCPIQILGVTGTVQLADALTLGSTRTLTLGSGTFDAVSYNVTTGLCIVSGSTTRTLKMGSGTWTLAGTGNIWDASTITNLNFYKGTANITLSDTSSSARTFAGGGLSYNKLTIGGATGTSTLTISGNNQFTELASTKTVAHTIALGTTTQTFGKWSVTGTLGNVVTLTGTGTSHVLAGAATSGIDYLAMGSIGFAATSPGEFYAGANSTGTASAPVYRTAPPAATTRYWVGGTGTWDATTTTNWSTSSGGAGGASVPTSLDNVIFDTSSSTANAAYTVTIGTGATVRAKAITMGGPGAGNNITWAGSGTMVMHDDFDLTAGTADCTRTFTGSIVLSGSTSGFTFNSNGVTLASAITVNGFDCGWALGSALDVGASNITLVAGSFDTAGYAVTARQVSTTIQNTRSLSLGASTLTLSNVFALNNLNNIDLSGTLTFNAGTSSIVLTPTGASFGSNGETFYNVSFTSTSATVHNFFGSAVFNNLTFAGRTSAGVSEVQLKADQTINGTLTLSAGTNATMRTFVRSNTIGTTRTLTCAAVASLTDIDFRDITIAGAAAPVSGTRLGDAKGNSGITFDAAKTVYVRSTGSANWSSSTGWSATSGGAADVTQFPLAQDTAVFPAATYPSSGSTITVDQSYNIGTIDMSLRTSNTVTLATGTTAPTIYGNWINGTGTTLSGTGTLTFAGRGAQTITSAGKTFTQPFTINNPGGSVTLQDAFTGTTTGVFTIAAGTFNANNFNVALTGAQITTSATTTKTIAFGSGTWTLGGSVPWAGPDRASTTITGTGVISLTSASAKSFSGNGISYSGITLDQGGAGTLTIGGNNTFKDITNSYKATGAATISIGTTTQTVSQFTAAGESGRVLTLQGTSASSPGTLVLSTTTKPNVDYLTITGVRAYSLDTTWYAGTNSTNNGSLGWYFEVAPASGTTNNFFLVF